MLGKSKGDQVRLIQRAIEAIRNQPDLSPDAKKKKRDRIPQEGPQPTQCMLDLVRCPFA